MDERVAVSVKAKTEGGGGIVLSTVAFQNTSGSGKIVLSVDQTTGRNFNQIVET